MGHKTLVGGTAYEIQKGKTLVDGTGREISGGRTLVNGTGYGVSFGTPLSEIPVATIINLPENGVLVPFYVAMHDYEKSLNGAGRTLLVRRDTYQDMQWNTTSSNVYPNSNIDKWLNNTYKTFFSSEIKTAMNTTKFQYLKQSGSSKVATNVSKSVFLLSLAEMALTHGTAAIDVGTALPIAEHLHIVARDGALSTQWTRTVGTSSQANVCYVQSPNWYAHITATDATTTGVGVRPCFTLPSDFKISL